jgi:hypothetical protein
MEHKYDELVRLGFDVSRCDKEFLVGISTWPENELRSLLLTRMGEFSELEIIALKVAFSKLSD